MSEWQIKIPDTFDLKSLSKWAADCIDEGIPREIISTALLDQMIKNHSHPHAMSQVGDSISRVMLYRNQKGIELEKAGSIDEAISLYESNIADWFSGNHPYDRLRVIYTKRGQISEALRVCEAFIRVADELISLGSPRGDLPIKRDRFAEYTRKLKTKLSNSK